jgi:hypothetical protein
MSNDKSLLDERCDDGYEDEAAFIDLVFTGVKMVDERSHGHRE